MPSLTRQTETLEARSANTARLLSLLVPTSLILLIPSLSWSYIPVEGSFNPGYGLLPEISQASMVIYAVVMSGAAAGSVFGLYWMRQKIVLNLACAILGACIGAISLFLVFIGGTAQGGISVLGWILIWILFVVLPAVLTSFVIQGIQLFLVHLRHRQAIHEQNILLPEDRESGRYDG